MSLAPDASFPTISELTTPSSANSFASTLLLWKKGMFIMDQNGAKFDGHRGSAAEDSISSTPMLDQEEAARFLHVQPRTLESWRQRRIGPRFVRYSMRCVRYREQDLQTWLDSQSIDTKNSEDQ